jgi:hypothetical protein
LTSQPAQICVISGFYHNVNDICALLGYWAAQNGNFILPWCSCLSVASLTVKQLWTLTMGLTGCPKMLVQNYHSTLPNILEQCGSPLQTGCYITDTQIKYAASKIKILWSYSSKYINFNGTVKINWLYSNITKEYSVALLLQYLYTKFIIYCYYYTTDIFYNLYTHLYHNFITFFSFFDN